MIGKRLRGLIVTFVAFGVTCAVYYLLPYNVTFPAIILAVPLVTAVAGIFQLATGMSLIEANASLPSWPFAKKFAVVSLALFLLVVAMFAFVIFVAETEL